MLACGALGSIPSTAKKKEQEKKKQPNKAWRVPGLEQQSVNVALGNMVRHGFPSVPARNKALWFA